MRTKLLRVLLLAWLISPDPVHAAAPNYDRRAETPPSASAVSSMRIRTDNSALQAIAHVSETDELFGIPTFLWAEPTTKTAGGTGKPPSIDAAAAGELARVAGFYGLDHADLATSSLRRAHDTGRGGIIATFRQSIDGIEVFGEELNLLLDRNFDLVAASGFLSSHNEGNAGIFRLDAVAAARRALEDFTGSGTLAVVSHGAVPGGFEAFSAIGFAGQESEPIRAKKVLFHLPGRFLPAYQVEVLGESEAYAYVFSAEDGSLLFRRGLIQDVSYTYRAWADASLPFTPFDGPQGTSASPVPTSSPAPYNPVLALPVLVSLQNAAIPTNDPWLLAGATQTLGNNVDAYADFNAPDGFSGADLRATTTAPNTFDRVYDTSQVPGASTNQRMAAVTQMFFTLNQLHDDYYAAGFDEASGNAQTDNYGRGGIAGDNLKAEAQDYSGTNNADMTTPSDGGHPRMQTYVFNNPTVVTLTVNAPGAIAGAKASGRCAFGPQGYSLTADVVVGVDGSGSPNDGCSPLVNSVAGKIVLLDRGPCTFAFQAASAQAAGAVGVIIGNNVAGSAPNLGGSGAISIPVQSVTNTDAAAIRAQLSSTTVNVTMTGATQLQRDASIDNQTVAHEYGHYVSNRLIGDGVGLGNNQGGGLGEGWGDFQALLLTVRAEDGAFGPGDWSGCYGLSAFAISPSSVGGSTYYFGVRRYPYTTDMTKNPLTFQHIQNGVTLPAGPPLNPIAVPNAEVHNTGTVWCTMLWECYASLLRNRGLPFNQARTRMRDYLVASYKMTPVNPTITEARDALLAVAFAADPADHALFCAAFARRGCGSGAISPPRYSDDNIAVVESYVCGGALQFVSASVSDDIGSCDSDGILDNGEFGKVQVILRNVGVSTLSATTVTVTSSNPAVIFPVGHVISLHASAPYSNVSGSLEVGVSGATGVSPLDLSFSIADPGLVVAAPGGVLIAQGNGDPFPSTSENFEISAAAWTTSGSPAVPEIAWARTAFTNTWSFFAPDAGGVSDQSGISPALQVGPGASAFSFQERHSFEASGGVFYDGGVLEITDNNGASWTDIGASASPGYGGSLFNGTGNPLSSRSAYVGTNAAYPNFTNVNVNLGSVYAGKTVKIRFRVGTDAGTGGFGWAVDNFAFNNLTNKPFTELSGETGTCNLVATPDASPTEFALGVAGPNPSRLMPALRFALPEAGHVTIALYDIRGRRVALVVSDEFPAGWHEAPARNASLPDGMYFARMEVAGRKLVRRLIVLH